MNTTTAQTQKEQSEIESIRSRSEKAYYEQSELNQRFLNLLQKLSFRDVSVSWQNVIEGKSEPSPRTISEMERMETIVMGLERNNSDYVNLLNRLEQIV